MRHPATLGLILLLLGGLPAEAQSGRVGGSVIDETAAVLPGATVTLSGPEETRVTQSDGAGEYVFAGVAAGNYVVTVALAGFLEATVPDVAVAGVPVELPPVTLALASFGDTVVVTASRTEVRVVDAPVTTSVVTGESLATTASSNVGDVLRSVPGVNVIQLSARDVQVTSRQSTGAVTNSQLVLMDGRSLYLDFFGLVMWDLLPANQGDIEQIEVVRGPASATWGANAMTGAVNIITRPPRQSVGTTVTMSGGWIDREAGSTVGQGVGSVFGTNATVTRAPTDPAGLPHQRRLLSVRCLPAPDGPDSGHRGSAGAGSHGGRCAVSGRPRRYVRRRFRQPGHEPAEVRRAGGPGPVGRPALLLGRRGRNRGAGAHRGGPVRRPARVVHGLRQGGVRARQPPGAGVHEPAQRRRAESPAAGPGHGAAGPSRVQVPDRRCGDRPLDVRRPAELPDLRRQRAPQHLRHHHRTGRERTASSSAPTCRTRSSSTASASCSAGGSTSSATWRSRCSRPACRS